MKIAFYPTQKAASPFVCETAFANRLFFIAYFRVKDWQSVH